VHEMTIKLVHSSG